MFRPWRDDPRPVWQVRTTWSARQLTSANRGALLETLVETGYVRAPSVDVGDAHLTVTMLLHARDRQLAKVAAVRIAEVAYRKAGLGSLGMNLGCVARPARSSAARHGVSTIA